jgi:Raf kinase inhibitor-like YbhB/YbcL family protein
MPRRERHREHREHREHHSPHREHHSPHRHHSECQEFQLLSTAFENGQPIPLVNTAASGGSNLSPELSWYNAPSKTHTFVLIVDDPSDQCVVGRTFINWVVYNIPSSTNNFAQGVAIMSPAAQVVNDSGSANYYGPNPQNTKIHKYRFTLFALKQSLNSFPLSLTAHEFEEFVQPIVLGKAVLIGTYLK